MRSAQYLRVAGVDVVCLPAFNVPDTIDTLEPEAYFHDYRITGGVARPVQVAKWVPAAHSLGQWLDVTDTIANTSSLTAIVRELAVREGMIDDDRTGARDG